MKRICIKCKEEINDNDYISSDLFKGCFMHRKCYEQNKIVIPKDYFI